MSNIVPKKVYKQIEWHFFNYDKVREEIEQKTQNREDIIDSAIKPMTLSHDVGHGVGKHSDSTAILGEKLVRNGEEVDRLRKWLLVVDRTKERLADKPSSIKLIELYYSKYKSVKGPERERKVTKELYVSPRTMYNIKKDVVLVAALQAAQLGLVEF